MHRRRRVAAAAMGGLTLLATACGTRLPDSAFQRFGTHNQAGKQTLEQVLKKSTDQLEHHLKFIHAKREKMGKEMW